MKLRNLNSIKGELYMSKKKKVSIVTHRHQDHLGNICGAPHPIMAKHKKASTQILHDLTIKKN